MRFLDRTRAFLRVVFFNTNWGTVSAEAEAEAGAARLEKERANRALDKLLSDLRRQREQKKNTEQHRAAGAGR